jgi:lipocalin-like protein
MRALFAALLLTLSGPAFTQEAHPLVGSWKLISLQAIVEGEAPEESFGANPKGYLIATREGRISVLFTAEHRKGGMGDAERAALHKSMVAVTGKYRVEGSDLIISVDVSWNETWNGTELRRHVRFDGDRMIVDTAPGPSFMHPGKTLVARLVFEREK